MNSLNIFKAHSLQGLQNSHSATSLHLQCTMYKQKSEKNGTTKANWVWWGLLVWSGNTKLLNVHYVAIVWDILLILSQIGLSDQSSMKHLLSGHSISTLDSHKTIPFKTCAAINHTSVRCQCCSCRLVLLPLFCELHYSRNCGPSDMCCVTPALKPWLGVSRPNDMGVCEGKEK